MAHFTVVVSAPVPAAVAWDRVLDLSAHGAVIPLTAVTRLVEEAVGSGPGGESGAGPGLAVGSRFVARTGWGFLGFDDVMTVEVLRPPRGGVPGFARIRKEDRLVGGWIDLVVAGDGVASSRVVWSQVITVYGVPRAFDPLVAICGRAAYGWALRRLLARGG